MCGLLVRLVFWVWFGAAILVGQSGQLRQIPPLAVHGIVLGLTAVLLLFYLGVGGVRRWVDGLEVRTLILLHLTRFAGIYLLVLQQRGELPRPFAVPVGIGEIIVATMVLPVAFAPLDPRARLRAITIWNVVGFTGMLLVMVGLARLHFSDPRHLRPFLQLPLSLLPTFLMPLIMASHVIIYARTNRERRTLESGGTESIG
jgi:hypothetical protein